MKLVQLTFLLYLFPLGLWAQSPLMQNIQQALDSGTRFEPVEVFSPAGSLEPSMIEVLSEGNLLNLNQTALQQLYQANLPAIELKIPLANGDIISVLLLQQKLLTDDFRVSTSSLLGGAYPVKPGRYYAGVVKGSSKSLAAISIFENEVMGVLQTAEEGSMELGKLEKDVKQRYVLFQTDKLDFQPAFDCGIDEIDHPKPDEVQAMGDYNSLNCVRIFFECEHDMYNANGSSVQNTINYMTGVYNVVKTLYDNDNIETTISEILVWDTPDSYSTTSTSAALNSFKAYRTNFNGDLAHLVSRGAPTGGGIAWVDVLCNSSYSYAYSYIYQSYNNFPTYSWTVNVIAHEMGHNLGSSHTHDCVWDVNGDGNSNEAIDGCGPAAGYSGNGTCDDGPLPTANGGTIMSYCHLLGNVGINWNNGFGPLPAAKIQSRVYNASCLSTCSNCTHTVSISKTDILCNGEATGSATANPSGGTPPYVYAWSNGGNTQTISDLTAGAYTVTVTDDSGCQETATTTITEPSALNLSASTTPESYQGANDGAINLSVSGGTSPYSYSWSNGPTTQDQSNLPGGNYIVTVTDNNSCTASLTVQVNTLTCDNQVTVFPYNESFEGSFGLWEQPTNDGFDWILRVGNTPTKKTGPVGAYNGSYYPYTEANGNTGFAYLLSPCLDFSNKTNQSVSFRYSMYGSQMGSLALEASNNNGGTWTELWSLSGDQGKNWQLATVDLTGYSSPFSKVRFVGTLGGGPRSDMAIDAINVNAEAPPCDAPVLTTSNIPVSCSGGSDGTASVSASGGNGSYTYLWSNNGTSPAISNLSAGSYTVTVTSDGCEETATVIITEPGLIALTFAVTNVSAPGAGDGAIDLTVSGGTGSYTYLWSNQSTSEDLTGLNEGPYTVTVTDANGCTATGTATVVVASPCTPLANIPYTESFDSNLGDWTQSTGDDTNWTRYSGSTPTKRTGPSSASNGSHYLYTEATNHQGQTAILEGPCFDLNGIVNPNFSFDYHMYGNNMGTLYLEISTNNGSSWDPLWSLSGNQGNGWVTEAVDLTTYVPQTIKLRFRGVIGGGQKSDMAVDYVRMVDTPPLPAGLTTGTISFALLPNPASEEIFVRMDSEMEKPVQLFITDLSGRRYLSLEEKAVSGTNEWTISVDQLTNGMYWLIIQDGKDRQIEKFVVQH